MSRPFVSSGAREVVGSSGITSGRRCVVGVDHQARLVDSLPIGSNCNLDDDGGSHLVNASR